MSYTKNYGTPCSEMLKKKKIIEFKQNKNQVYTVQVYSSQVQIIIILHDKPYFYFIYMICILLLVDTKKE